jgi:DHA1 family putative efflux transporter-like MFS transporter
VIFWGIGLFTLLGIFAVAKAIPSTKGESSVPLGKQLALIKNPKITTALSMTFFVFIGYSVVKTYITPFLTSVMSFSGGMVSVILFVLGIASLIGSKLGGFLADRTGTARTLVLSMIVQALSLALLSIASGLNFVDIPLLVLWTIAAWTVGRRYCRSAGLEPLRRRSSWRPFPWGLPVGSRIARRRSEPVMDVWIRSNRFTNNFKKLEDYICKT